MRWLLSSWIERLFHAFWMVFFNVNYLSDLDNNLVWCVESTFQFFVLDFILDAVQD